MRIALNVLQSQLAWFALVLSAAAGHAWWGIAAALMLITLHLLLAVEDRRRELTVIITAALVGAVGDTVLAQLGFIRFAAAPHDIAPAWMIVLWMAFATTLRHSFAWLQMRLLVAVPLGAFAGPLAYAAGVALGALETGETTSSYLAIGTLWALALPLLSFIAHYRDSSDPLVART